LEEKVKVWIGYHCHYDGADIYEIVVKVFDDEAKALLWAEDKEFVQKHDVDIDWRRYEECDVEQ
jgi:hypothetical protein